MKAGIGLESKVGSKLYLCDRMAFWYMEIGR